MDGWQCVAQVAVSRSYQISRQYNYSYRVFNCITYSDKVRLWSSKVVKSYSFSRNWTYWVLACTYACSVTAYNSTDIGVEQDNVGSDPCNSYDGHNLYQYWYQACYRAHVIDCALSCLLQPVLTHCNRSVANIPVSFCYIRLIQHWQIDRLLQSSGADLEVSRIN